MTRKMLVPLDGRFARAGWDKRFAHGVKLVLDQGYTVSQAARLVGVSRHRLSEKVTAERKRRKEAARAVLQPALVTETRRVGTFEEFDRRYFSRWTCADCARHHDMPDFHREIVDRLQDPNVHRLLVNLPPYHAKTTLVSVKHTIYKLVSNPNHRRIVVSRSREFAQDIVHLVTQFLTVPELYGDGPNLIHDWGPFQAQGQPWTRTAIWVHGRMSHDKDPSLLALGVGGQIYGRRADDIVLDDVATVDNQRSPASVTKMLDWLLKEVTSRVGKQGRIIVLGTRVWPGDIYWHLSQLPGWEVLRFSCITDEASRTTLWPEHFPWEQAERLRAEMSHEQWQLVYQNVELPGAAAVFSTDAVESCKDPERTRGHWEADWRLVAGVDLAGPTASSGYTSVTVLAVDPETGKRYLVDWYNQRSMKAPEIVELIRNIADAYPLREVRVEANGLQAQILQYNEELVRYLAANGVRLSPHVTSGSNKWDPRFGVEGLAPLFEQQMVSIPWRTAQDRSLFEPLLQQFLLFPLGAVDDGVMSFWIANLALREGAGRARLPLFSSRLRVPARVARRRVVVDFANREVVPVRDLPHRKAFGNLPPPPERLVNVSPSVWYPGGE